MQGLYLATRFDLAAAQRVTLPDDRRRLLDTSKKVAPGSI
jgi:hypothetical protein